MRLLADENFPGDTVKALRDAGYDIEWMITESPGDKDPDVLRRAIAESRILVTFDKDFGELYQIRVKDGFLKRMGHRPIPTGDVGVFVGRSL